MMHITEDTPPDMLAGAMDLAVSLPDGRDVKMAVERSTPMMDLLVQVTTAYKLRPSDHIIQAMDMSGGPHSDRVLPYKPNTPIGALDTQNIRVLPKGRSLPMPRNIAPGHQPFESTFRLQVHLPRNQFCVIRVGKQCMLEDIMGRVCEEKNLDPRKYEFRHPTNIDQVLDPKRTLSDYEITEITVVPRGSGRLPQTLSSGDIMSLQREEERRKMQAKTGGGVLNLIFRRGRNSMGSGSISSDTRSISPTQSDDSRSVTPPAVQPPQILPSIPQEQTSKPKPPQRKRRPAPKPPQNNFQHPQEPTPAVQEQKQQQETKLDNGLTICHSRNSSDSSGYHEASILSDNCNTTLPRRPKSTVIHSVSGDSALGMDKSGDLSKSTGNLSNMADHSKSSTSLTNAGRKKKAPPPPPVMKASSSVANIPVKLTSPPASAGSVVVTTGIKNVAASSSIVSTNSKTVVASPPVIAASTPPLVKPIVDQKIPVEIPQKTLEVIDAKNKPVVEQKPADSSVCPTPTVDSSRTSVTSLHSLSFDKPSLKDTSSTPKQSPEITTPVHTTKSINTYAENINTSNKDLKLKNNNETPEKKVHKELPPLILEKKLEVEDENDLYWQYQLPSPPKAFRDLSPTNFTDTTTNFDSVTFNGLSTDTIITPPSSFDKDPNKEIHSEVTEDNTDARILTSKYLSLENLEKRKSLVLERELASLKIAQTETNNKNSDAENMLRNQRNSLLNEIEEVIQNSNKNGRSASLSRTNSQSREKILHSATDSTLPNFKITTYDQSKSKVNIFEDDSVRSNVDYKITENVQKRNSIADINVTFKAKNYEVEDNFLKNKRNSISHTSTENISFLHNKMSSLDDDVFKKPQNYPVYKKNILANNTNLFQEKSTDSVSRSESMSQKNGWSRTNPVKRSKSQISLEKYKDERSHSQGNEENLQKSNSLWNVSGLQSLEVMRMILPKLGNTPPNSPTNNQLPESYKEGIQKRSSEDQIPRKQPEVPKDQPENKTSASQIEPPVKETPKVYQYRGPPSVNLGTWSERPKGQISLKEDKDYKISTTIGKMKAKFSSHTNINSEVAKPKTQENVASVNIRVNNVESKDQTDSGKINIKINSADAVTAKTISHQSSGNVIIKIGNTNNTTDQELVKKPDTRNFYSRFLNQTTAVGYRKPLGNINGVDKPRPHSIAFDSSCPDLSRVPIVRAVELKKPLKETQNTSITQIRHTDTETLTNGSGPRSFDIPEYKQDVKSNTLGNRYSSVYVSSENVNSSNSFLKPVSRVSSFAFTRPTNNVPVVKGFRFPPKDESYIENNSKNWSHHNQSYGTLPAKPSITQNNIPFSQQLKRTTTNHVNNFDKFNNAVNSTPLEKVVLRSTSNRNVQLNRSSLDSSFNTNGLPNGNAIPVPPAPPLLPKITSVTKKAPRQIEPQVDPRDQLLAAIRNFGGKTGLKSTKA